jgi:hypothetical protein
VLGLHDESVVGEPDPRTIAFDIHYIIFDRCVVIPMSFKADKVSLRTRPPLSYTKIVAAPPDRTPIEWLKFGLESSRHTKIGWLRDLLLQHNLLKADDKEALW